MLLFFYPSARVFPVGLSSNFYLFNPPRKKIDIKKNLEMLFGDGAAGMVF